MTFSPELITRLRRAFRATLARGTTLPRNINETNKLMRLVAGPATPFLYHPLIVRTRRFKAPYIRTAVRRSTGWPECTHGFGVGDKMTRFEELDAYDPVIRFFEGYTHDDPEDYGPEKWNDAVLPPITPDYLIEQTYDLSGYRPELRGWVLSLERLFKDPPRLHECDRLAYQAEVANDEPTGNVAFGKFADKEEQFEGDITALLTGTWFPENRTKYLAKTLEPRRQLVEMLAIPNRYKDRFEALAEGIRTIVTTHDPADGPLVPSDRFANALGLSYNPRVKLVTLKAA
jgi:hypothetical protein